MKLRTAKKKHKKAIRKFYERHNVDYVYSDGFYCMIINHLPIRKIYVRRRKSPKGHYVFFPGKVKYTGKSSLIKLMSLEQYVKENMHLLFRPSLTKYNEKETLTI